MEDLEADVVEEVETAELLLRQNLPRPVAKSS